MEVNSPVFIYFSPTKLFSLAAHPFMGLLNRALKLICWQIQALVSGELICAVLSVRGAYLHDFIVLNKLSNTARGKTNKAYENAATFSKIPTSDKCLWEILNTKVTNSFKLTQIQQERSHIKCFCFIVSEECCYHGSDWDTIVW